MKYNLRSWAVTIAFIAGLYVNAQNNPNHPEIQSRTNKQPTIWVGERNCCGDCWGRLLLQIQPAGLLLPVESFQFWGQRSNTGLLFNTAGYCLPGYSSSWQYLSLSRLPDAQVLHLKQLQVYKDTGRFVVDNNVDCGIVDANVKAAFYADVVWVFLVHILLMFMMLLSMLVLVVMLI